MKTSISLFLRTFMAAAMLTIAAMVSAQNTTGISRELVPLYQEAYKYKEKTRGLQLADSLLQIAKKRGDRYAELNAMGIRVYHEYHKKNNLKALDAAIKPVVKKAMEYKIIDYCFFMSDIRVYYLIHHERLTEAINYMNEMQQFAKKHFSHYGIYISHRTLGVIYRMRGDYALALEKFREAIAYAQLHIPYQITELTYVEPCVCYLRVMQYEKLLDAAEKGLKIGKHREGHSCLLAFKAYALFALGRYDEFRQAYNEIKTIPIKDFGRAKDVMTSVGAFHLALEGNPEETDKIIHSIESITDRAHAHTIFSKWKKDQAEANLYFRELLTAESSRKQANIVTDMAVYAAQLKERELEVDKERVNARNEQLALLNSQLQLRNTTLELNKTRDAQELAKMTDEQTRLSLEKQQLVDNHLRDSLYNQHFLEESWQQEIAQKRSLSRFVVIFAFIITVVTAIWLYHRRKRKRQLKATYLQLQKSHQELEVVSRKAQESDRQKTRFVQSISHEVRTPLNAIVGFSGVLTEMANDISEEEKKSLAQRITQNSQLLSKLVNDVLDLTSIESGRYEMRHEEITVNSLCHDAMDKCQHLLTPDVRLLFNTDVDDHFTIHGDQQRLDQVLTNLLSNSAKFTTSGNITLNVTTQSGTATSPGEISFTVTDTGSGIPADKMDTVFERFVKIDSFKQGTGLGLYICRVIAEKSGGSIRINEDYHDGAQFILTLPCE